MKWITSLFLSLSISFSAKADDFLLFHELLYVKDGIEVIEQISIRENEILVVSYPQREETEVFLEWEMAKLGKKDKNKLINLINKFGILKWKNDYHDKWCHGGHAKLSVAMSGKSNHSFGACSYPPNYKEFLNSVYTTVNDVMPNKHLKGAKYFMFGKDSQ